MKQVTVLFILLLCLGTHAFAQQGAITGVITDTKKETLIGVTVKALQQGRMVSSTATDLNGNYTIKNLQPGKYDIQAIYIGYKTSQIKGVIVAGGKTTGVNITMQVNAKELDEVVVESYSLPLIDHYAPGIPATKSANRIEKMASRSAQEINAVPAASNRARRKADSKYVYNTPPPQPAYYNRSNESYKKQQENDFMNVYANPLSTMSVDVDRASYSNVRRFLTAGQMPPADAVRVEEMINYFDYDYPQPEGDDPIAIATELTDCPWQNGHKLLHIGMQAKNISTENLPPSNLVFLIDVSGSMETENKLPLVKSALKMLVNNLRAEDKLSIVVYAGNAGLVLPATPGNQKRTIYAALDKLQAGGSTAGGAGIQLAYNIAAENFVHNGNNRVILATDGDFNVGMSGDNELEELITKERQRSIYLTCLGFGMGNYKDSKMEVLADKGNGNYAYIDNIREAQKTLVNEFGGTLFTVAKDVKAQIEFNPAYVQGYRLVGYENRLLNEEDFKDDKKDAGDMGSGHTVTIIYELIPTGINSKEVRRVTDLKYQQRDNDDEYNRIYHPYLKNDGGELATIKFRYKKPNGKTSKELVQVIHNNVHSIHAASNNARFATSVAMFGMLLKNSQYKGSSSYSKALALAKNSLGEDANGYRAEYLQLVKAAGGSVQDVAGLFDEED